MNENKGRQIVSSILIVAAVALLFPIYNLPIWWVSLEAPNYPEEAFPDGVRILFHANGIFNGCEMQNKTEIMEDEALDCVHEMDTINHYVGMYPIASGGPVELFFSIFWLALLGIMALAFMCVRPKIRTIIMVVGFGGLSIWMGMTYLGNGGLNYHSARYLEGRITVLGEDVEIVEEDSTPGSGDQLATLKESLAGSEDTALPEGMDALSALKASMERENVEVIEEDETVPAPEPEPTPEPVVVAEAEPTDVPEGKDKSLLYMQDAFEHYQTTKGDEAQEWTGSGAQVLTWHYEKSLGKYFRDPEVLRPMVAKITNAGNIIFWGCIAIMIFLIVMARKPQGLFNWLLVLIPIGLPVYFVLEYATWLWWYGHNMNEMGAFSLKAFMPTAFGQGKVAQFTTNSYPETGFWLMVLFAALLLVAAILRRKPAENVDDEEE